jgi:ubiquinone/menaquinone biosynthesis C-methylase UbiE
LWRDGPAILQLWGETMKNSNEYFAQVAGQWDEIRAEYFTERTRDAAIAKVNLPLGAVGADVGAGTGSSTFGVTGQGHLAH